MGHIYPRVASGSLIFEVVKQSLHPAFRDTIPPANMGVYEIPFTVPGVETAKNVLVRGSWDGYSEHYLLVWDKGSTA